MKVTYYGIKRSNFTLNQCFFTPSPRKSVDESAKLTGTVTCRVKRRIYDHVPNRSVYSFRLTVSTHSKFIISVYGLKGIYRVLENIRELIVSIYELKKVIHRVLQKRIWKSGKF